MMKNEAIAKKKRPTKARPKGSVNRNHSFPCLFLIAKNKTFPFRKRRRMTGTWESLLPRNSEIQWANVAPSITVKELSLIRL